VAVPALAYGPQTWKLAKEAEEKDINSRNEIL
jgi:hypothetical protein